MAHDGPIQSPGPGKGKVWLGSTTSAGGVKRGTIAVVGPDRAHRKAGA